MITLKNIENYFNKTVTSILFVEDIKTIKTKNNDKYDFDKIVILINNNSASGAEALSAALEDNMGDKVDLVGVTTYGKGSAQKMVYFTDGTYFNYTYALWYRPNGETIHKEGVDAEVSYVGDGIHLFNFTATTLEKNDYKKEVYTLKRIMEKLGYNPGNMTNLYDEDLEITIKKYQKDNSIPETGKLDELTIRYILAKCQDDKINDYKNEVNKVINDYKNYLAFSEKIYA